MAMMRPLKAITFLGLSPLVLASASCKNPNTILTRDKTPQCSTYSTNTPSKTFSFRLAASFSGKGTRYEPRRDVFHFHPHTGRPAERLRRDQRPNSGQDAFFIGEIDKTNDVAFAVADGVGGWAESGIDPSDFSHGLCEYMRIAAANPQDPGKLRPRDLLQTAYDATIIDETIFAGGSTACVAVGREDGTLEVAK
jgi:protein phosphatase PTC7